MRFNRYITMPSSRTLNLNTHTLYALNTSIIASIATTSVVSNHTQGSAAPTIAANTPIQGSSGIRKDSFSGALMGFA